MKKIFLIHQSPDWITYHEKGERFPKVLQHTARLQPLKTIELRLRTRLSQISIDPIQFRKYFTFR